MVRLAVISLSVITWVVLGFAARPALADYDAGVRAYEANDYARAISEFRDQAVRGHAGAQFMLGVLYFYGKGVVRDDGVAAAWFHKAALKGHAGAQLAFGSLFIDGVGVERDLTTAYTWLTLAADSGVPGLRQQAVVLRDDAAAKMTPRDVERASRRARNWKPRRAGFVIEE